MTEILTALSHQWESAVATTLEAVRGVVVSRRCADVAELLSVAEAGLGDTAVVSSDLRGLDLSVVDRLRSNRIRVIGVHPGDDEQAERRLRQLTISSTLPADAGPERWTRCLDDDSDVADLEGALAAGAGLDGGPDDVPGATRIDAHGGSSAGLAGPDDVGAGPAAGGVTGWLPAGASQPGPSIPSAGEDTADDAADHAAAPRRGRGPERAPLVAVWGPTGAPGRTVVATTLAAELASRGVEVLLVDADTYGGCVAQSLGLLDEAPGVAAACRAADQGLLDLPLLARLAPEVVPRLRVLTGLPKAERWPEVRSAALERVLDLSRSLVGVVVVDCGFCLEDDEELSYDTAAPRRNEATLTSLAASELVVAVGGADPVALQRFVRGLQELGTVPSGEPVPVVNRVRAGAVGSRPESRIADSLLRFAGLTSVRFVPDDPSALDGALLAGRSLVEHAPESPVRRAVGDLATAILPWTLPAGDRRQRTGGRGRRSRSSGRPSATVDA
ncbi:AAA family ATPase [Terrabacter terrigena]|uniref:CpaE family protein n=1 Tax=Terrabacter terrigena TaxID=574718 RepID=A0ABW3MQX1_9MICO